MKIKENKIIRVMRVSYQAVNVTTQQEVVFERHFMLSDWNTHWIENTKLRKLQVLEALHIAVKYILKEEVVAVELLPTSLNVSLKQYVKNNSNIKRTIEKRFPVVIVLFSYHHYLYNEDTQKVRIFKLADYPIKGSVNEKLRFLTNHEHYPYVEVKHIMREVLEDIQDRIPDSATIQQIETALSDEVFVKSILSNLKGESLNAENI